MTRILITGANGFAAPYVADELVKRGFEVHGLARESAMEEQEAFAGWHIADLGDTTQTQVAVAAAKPNAVIHLAAISFVAHGNPADIYMANIVGTRNLLASLATLKSLDGPTVIVSSANIYGNLTGGALHEELPPSPQSDYALSKVACEYLASMYSAQVRNFVVRPFNYTGVGQSADFIIPKIVQHVKSGADIIELGNLDVARDFSDVRFFATALIRLLDLPLVSAEKVNICSGRAYTLTEVLDLVAQISGRELKVVSNPLYKRLNEVERLWGDNRKLQKLIGPLEGPDLEATLRWMIDA